MRLGKFFFGDLEEVEEENEAKQETCVTPCAGRESIADYGILCELVPFCAFW